MQYIAIRPSGHPHTLNNEPVIVSAAFKWEAKSKLDALLPLGGFKIVTNYTVIQKIEKGILKACFSSYNDK